MVNMKKNDVEELKQKLIVYKQTLETMKSGSVVEDYLSMKSECYNLKKQLSELENDIKILKKKYEDHITSSNKKIDNLTEEMKSINLSIEIVKQDITALTVKIDSWNIEELRVKLETLSRNEVRLETSIKQGEKEMLDFKDEIMKLKSEVLASKRNSWQDLKNAATKIQPTSYQQLRKIIQTSPSSKNVLSHRPQPIGKDIANFYQSVSKKTQRASILPPTGPSLQKIEILNHINESNINDRKIKKLEKEAIDVQGNKVEERKDIVSETKNKDLTEDGSKSVDSYKTSEMSNEKDR